MVELNNVFLTRFNYLYLSRDKTNTLLIEVAILTVLGNKSGCLISIVSFTGSCTSCPLKDKTTHREVA